MWARLFCLTVLATALAFTRTLEAETPKKILRTAIQSAEKSFDCAVDSAEASGSICAHIFDSLLQYDHLARPIKLQPNTAVALPEISPDGRTYTLKIKPGITFTDHPAFGGKKRELVAADFVYSLKRLIDPRLKAQWNFLLDGKLVGADTLVAEAKKTGRFDYDKPIAGLEAPDKTTLIIRLKEPDFNLPYMLAMPATAAVAREIEAFYGAAFSDNPIGTGPYKLKEWRRSSKIVLEKKTDYREAYFETAGSADPRDQAIAAHLKGKRLPLIDQIEIYPIEEEQPRWLAYLGGEHDYIRPIPTPFIDAAMPGGKLAPHLATRGMSVRADEVAWLTYTTFNMQDPVIGGFGPEKIALRRAISMAYPVEEEIAVVEKNQAIKAYSPIAEGMAGFVAERNAFLDFNPARANALLDMYGYLDRDGDGWRELPNGAPLVIDQATTPDQRAKSRNELWARAMKAIGIRMRFEPVDKLPELRDKAKKGKLQMFTYGWIADYPDGENFFQLFTTGNIGAVNYALFSDAEFDRLYAQIRTMPDSPARTAIYQKMVHLLWVYNPWRVNTLKQGTILIQPWVLGYKKHPFAHEPWRYMDIDLTKLPKQ